MSHNTDNNALIKSLGLIGDSVRKITNKLPASMSFLDKSYKPTTLHCKEKNKQKKNKRNNSPLTLQGSIPLPPVTSILLHLQRKLHSHKPEHINTYPQEPKWTTFSRVRPSTPPLSCSFFMKTKKWSAVVGIRGLAGPLSLPCCGKNCTM